ncbi:MAG: hypothetical protein IK014_08100 [Lachnospiraceae bacterium]|nr:hypothetical protein [Lachnospiraceae bacterium]
MNNSNFNANGNGDNSGYDPIARKLQEMAKQEAAASAGAPGQRTQTGSTVYPGTQAQSTSSQSSHPQPAPMPGVWYPGMPAQSSTDQGSSFQGRTDMGRPNQPQGGYPGNGSPYQSPYASPYSGPVYGGNVTPQKKSGGARTVIAVILIIAILAGVGAGAYFYKKSQDKKEQEASISGTQTEPGAPTEIGDPSLPVTILGITDKEAKTYENVYFSMGCSLDDSWTIEKTQYNLVPKDIADKYPSIAGLQTSPDGSIPLMANYDLDFFARRPGDVILIYVKDKDKIPPYNSETEFFVYNQLASSESEIEKVNFLGKDRAAKLIENDKDHKTYNKFIVMENESQYMVIYLVSAYQDNTDDLMSYFYIPGQTTVADEVKHPESDGYVLMCVPGYHENFKVTASSTYSAKGYKFSTDGLSDADYRTGWCGENPKGDSITYEFDDTVGFRKLILVNGNVKDEASYNAYGKVKKLRLDFDGGFYESEIKQVSYSDFMNNDVANILDFQKIIYTKSLKITVLETIPGTENELPCISDIVVGYKMKAFVTRKSTGEKIYIEPNGISFGNWESDDVQIPDKSFEGKMMSIFFSSDLPVAMAAMNPPSITVDGEKLYSTDKMMLNNGSKIKIIKEEFTFGVEP